MAWLTEPFGFAFMVNALLALLLLVPLCATVGAYVVVRRLSFLSHALAHAILPGMAGAALAGIDLTLGALAAAVLAAIAVSLFKDTRRAEAHDTAIGIVVGAMFALGLLISDAVPGATKLDAMLFGSIMSVTGADLAFLGASALACTAVLAALHKELELSSFDPDYAAQAGMRPSWLSRLLIICAAVTSVAVIKALGVVLAGILVITPAATAALFARSLRGLMLWGALFTATAAVAGLLVTYHADTRPSATLVLTLVAAHLVVRAGVALCNRRRRNA